MHQNNKTAATNIPKGSKSFSRWPEHRLQPSGIQISHREYQSAKQSQSEAPCRRWFILTIALLLLYTGRWKHVQKPGTIQLRGPTCSTHGEDLSQVCWSQKATRFSHVLLYPSSIPQGLPCGGPWSKNSITKFGWTRIDNEHIVSLFALQNMDLYPTRVGAYMLPGSCNGSWSVHLLVGVVTHSWLSLKWDKTPYLRLKQIQTILQSPLQLKHWEGPIS